MDSAILGSSVGEDHAMKRTLRKAATSLLLIVVVAVGARLAFAWGQARKIPEAALATAPFEQETGSIARSIATGSGFSNPFGRETGPTAWLTPVYPLLVAAAFKIFGIFTIRSFFFLVFLNILFSAAVCVPIFYAGKKIANLGVASAAAWLWALFPNAIMTPFEWIWDTSLAALLAATLLWATLELAESQRLRDWCFYGLLWGVTLMTNPSLGSLLPFLTGWAAYRVWRRGNPRPSASAWIARPALALGLAILCSIPWTIRNYTVFHRFVPLRSNFPLELYIGNNENYDDKHARFPGPITKERETVRYFRMGETAFMHEEMRKAAGFIVTHPRVELFLTGERFVAFWAGIPHPIDKFIAADSWLVRAVILWATFSGIGAFFGIVALIGKHREYAFPLATFPVIFPFLYYVTHTSLRYRHPIDPIVLLLTAIAAGLLGQSLSRRPATMATNRSPDAPATSA